MGELTRRDALIVAGAGAAAASLAEGRALAQGAASRVPAFAGQHQPRPLRFDPAKLTGLSERLVRSHWENNYQGSVRALNLVEQRLATAMADADFPPVLYGGLKR
jgi:Fe-Mn family superoxide dismutase